MQVKVQRWAVFRETCGGLNSKFVLKGRAARRDGGLKGKNNSMDRNRYRESGRWEKVPVLTSRRQGQERRAHSLAFLLKLKSSSYFGQKKT